MKWLFCSSKLVLSHPSHCHIWLSKKKNDHLCPSEPTACHMLLWSANLLGHKKQSGWGFTVRWGKRTKHKETLSNPLSPVFFFIFFFFFLLSVPAFLQSNTGSRDSHSCSTVADLPKWSKDHSCHHSHRFNEDAANRRPCNGVLALGMQPCIAFSCKDCYGFTALAMLNPEGISMWLLAHSLAEHRHWEVWGTSD